MNDQLTFSDGIIFGLGIADVAMMGLMAYDGVPLVGYIIPGFTGAIALGYTAYKYWWLA